jgi:tetratricopeptide (TPR) repeat protein
MNSALGETLAGNPEQFGTVSAALAQARRLLMSNPSRAEAQLGEILNVVPSQPEALLLLGSARRVQGDAVQALAVLKPLAASLPKNAGVQFELGLAYADRDESTKAIAAFRRTAALDPDHAHAWRALGDQFTLTGNARAADDAYARHIKASVNDPRLREAATALCENNLASGERLLRAFLLEHPTDVAAIRMLAEIGARLGRYEEAEKLLARCVALALGFDAARFNYATILHRQNKMQEALAQIEHLLTREPKNAGYRNLEAAALARLGETTRAIAAYEAVLKDHPKQAKAWMSYGHTLKTAGHQNESIDAYWKSIALQPGLGEAYWSLANLKTFRFTPEQIAAMRAQLARTNLEEEDRFHFHFALGKAMEDAQAYAESFEHYAKANELRRESLPYNADEFSRSVQRHKKFFTPEFFAARAHVGCPAPDPIFVVGLPRSGSTLIEQILASHSAVEGTMELPDIMAIARKLGGRKKMEDDSAYPDTLAALDYDALRMLGEEYLQNTRMHRKLNRPFFIDKMPNNFVHAGLIHLILPNAKIIDARRHPLACCFSNFKQHFARGQGFAYNLTDIGRYYRDYVEMMAHYDHVLPGRIHRVIYEDVVADPEAEIRRMLAYCGLPFEENCLLFYQNERTVRTASSEQVRMPIFTDAVDQWRNYEAWLEPLKDVLGPVLANYPHAPVFQEAQHA